ncbi:MAG TPA: dynamin family protein [Thermomicrobiales bacterium]|jgi:small GTP-binding protein|nr:dynamin family protein [Thermomicrobiales bacterium]
MARGVFRFQGRGRDERPTAVLSDRQHQLIQDELDLLGRARTILAGYPATAADLAEMDRAAEQLGALFLLVIVGEFNAGKSAFINALVGVQVMPEGVLPTTAVINRLRFGEQPSETMLPDGVIDRTFPADFLHDITVVDTPGTNAIIREHEKLTQQFVPRADLVLFVTSADRPFSESERQFMAGIREWGKKIVVVVNKVDLLPSAAAREEVEKFVRDNVARLVGFAPDVFSVSAMKASQAKQLGQRNPPERDRLWAESRFEPVEDYVVRELDQESRIRLKLSNPLGIAEHTAERYLRDSARRLDVLRDDVQTIETIDRQLGVYQDDMRRQFEYHLSRVEAIIARMITRGDAFFEDTIRIGRVFDLLNTDKVRTMFEQQVVSDTARRIDDTIDELIDWMVEQDLRTWEAVSDYVNRRRLDKYEEQLVGGISSQFRYDRRSLLDSVSKRAREEIDRFDARKEAAELSQSVRNAVAATAVAEAGAVGLGALVVAAASTVAVDITGILAASLVAGVGLFVLPRRRRKAREEFHQRASELEQRLITVMRDQFEYELNRSVGRITEAIAPYTRFVRSETTRLGEFERDMTATRNDLRAFRHRIGVTDDVIDPEVRAVVAGEGLPELPRSGSNATD